jgi:hypothetical protein
VRVFAACANSGDRELRCEEFAVPFFRRTAQNYSCLAASSDCFSHETSAPTSSPARSPGRYRVFQHYARHSVAPARETAPRRTNHVSRGMLINFEGSWIAPQVKSMFRRTVNSAALLNRTIGSRKVSVSPIFDTRVHCLDLRSSPSARSVLIRGMLTIFMDRIFPLDRLLAPARSDHRGKLIQSSH